MAIMQGDQYELPFKLKDETGSTITAAAIEKIEMVIGDITKYYPESITFNSTTETFNFPLTEEETFKLKANSAIAQIRVLFKDTGVVLGKNCGFINVGESASKVVLNDE